MTTRYIPISTIVLGACAFAQVPFGSVQGLVTGDDGAPISNVVVSYSRLTRLIGRAAVARPAPGEAIARGRISSASDGKFAIGNLPAGQYMFCAEVPGTPFLNPCKWSAAPTVTIAEAEHRPTIVLKRGVFMKVRIEDPKGLLPPFSNDPSRAPQLIVGVVFGSGAFLAAEMTGVDRRGRDYRMAVPAGVPLRLWTFSRHVMLTDSQGAVVDNRGGKIPFQAVADRDHVVVLNVTGRDPELFQ